ncbi:MAG: hypothetical protein K2G30_02175 [Muribaculaceae bacterium]|nr:hypothetical protein [Muribaculaceae bacterium]
MEINLNSKTIIDELMAVAALRSRTAGGRGAARALLTADQLPALRHIARMAFAELCMRLGSLVEASDMDFEDPEPDEPYSAAASLRMSLTLSAGSVGDGRGLAAKRSLEHAVAMLAAAFALGDAADGSAAELRGEAAAAVDALRDVLGATATDGGSGGVPRRAVPFFF